MSAKGVVRVGDTVWYWRPGEAGDVYDGQPLAAIVTALSGNLANLCVFGRKGDPRQRMAIESWGAERRPPLGLECWQARPSPEEPNG